MSEKRMLKSMESLDSIGKDGLRRGVQGHSGVRDKDVGDDFNEGVRIQDDIGVFEKF